MVPHVARVEATVWGFSNLGKISSLDQGVWNISLLMCLLQIGLKCRFWVSGTKAGPGILHFDKLSADHTEEQGCGN